MPAFVITTSQPSRTGTTIDAIMCDPAATGYPDRHSDLPVRATISEKTITIDDEPRPRAIISSVGMNGTGTYLVDGSSKNLRNRERRIALNQALAQLQQLTATIKPLWQASEDPSLAVEGVG